MIGVTLVKQSHLCSILLMDVDQVPCDVSVEALIYNNVSVLRETNSQIKCIKSGLASHGGSNAQPSAHKAIADL